MNLERLFSLLASLGVLCVYVFDFEHPGGGQGTGRVPHPLSLNQQLLADSKLTGSPRTLLLLLPSTLKRATNTNTWLYVASAGSSSSHQAHTIRVLFTKPVPPAS